MLTAIDALEVLNAPKTAATPFNTGAQLCIRKCIALNL